MNCLFFQNPDHYVESIKNYSQHQLSKELKKHLFINEKLRFEYNLMRSFIYINTIEELDSLSVKDSKEKIEKIKELFEFSIDYLTRYIDIPEVIKQCGVLLDVEVKEDDLLEKVIEESSKSRVYFNTFIDLCVSIKNHLIYFYKKFFKQVYESSIRPDYHYDSELSFKTDEDDKKFELSEDLPANLDGDELIKEIKDSLILTIRLNDKMMLIRS